MLIMRTKKRLYLGEVLDIYKKIACRHGSIPKATSCAGLPYFSLWAYLPLSVVSFAVMMLDIEMLTVYYSHTRTTRTSLLTRMTRLLPCHSLAALATQETSILMHPPVTFCTTWAATPQLVHQRR